MLTAFLGVLTVFPFALTCSFIRTRQSSYRGFSIRTKRSPITNTSRSVSYLDLHLDIDSGLRTTLYNRRWVQFSHCKLSIYM